MSTDTIRPPTSRQRRPLWLRAVRGLGWSAVVLLITCALAYAFRGRILEVVANFMLHGAEGELAFRRVDGNCLTSVHIEQCTWSAHGPGTAIQSCEIAEISASYSLWRRWRGEPDWFESLSLRGVDARVDLRGRPSSGAGGEARAAREPWKWPSRLPALEATEVRGELALANDRRISVEGLSLRQGPTPAALSLSVEKLSFDDSRLGERSGRLAAELEHQQGRFDIRELSLDGEPVLGASHVDLSRLASREVGFDLDFTVFAGRAHFSGALQDGLLHTGFALEHLELEPAWRFAIPADPDPARGGIQASGELRLPLTQPSDLELTLRGSGSGVCFRGRELGHIDAELAWAGNVLAITDLKLARGRNRLDVKAASVPLDTHDPWSALRASRGEVDLEWFDLGELLEGSPKGPMPVHRLRLKASLQQDAVELHAGDLETEGGHCTIRSGRVTWSEDPERLIQDAALELELDFTDLSAVAALWGKKDWSGSLRGAAHVSGNPQAPAGHFELRGAGVVAAGWPIGELEIEARADRERIEAGRVAASGELGELEVSGALRLVDGELEGVRFSFDGANLARLVPDVFDSGSARIEGEAQGPWRSPSASFTAEGRDLGLKGRLLERLEVRGGLEPGVIRFDQVEIELEGTSLAGSGRLEHDDWHSPFAIHVAALSAMRGELDLALQEPALVRIDGGTLLVEKLCAAGSAGKLTANLALEGAGAEVLRLHATAEDLRAMQLVGPLLPRGLFIEGVQGELSLERSQSHLELEGGLAIDRLSFEGYLPDSKLRARGRFADRRLSLEECSLESPSKVLLELSGTAPFDPFAEAGEGRLPDGPLELHGAIELPRISELPWRALERMQAWAGNLGVRFDFEGSWTAPAGSLDLDLAVNLKEPLAPVQAAEIDAFAARGRVLLSPGIRLEDLNVEIPGRAVLALTGTAGISTDVRAWIAGRGPPPGWKSAPLSLRGSLESKDLSFFAALAPSSTQVAGALQTEISLEGTLSEPVLDGSFAVQHGEFRTADGLLALEALDARLAFARDRVSVETLSGLFAAVPFSVSGELLAEPGGSLLDSRLHVKGLRVDVPEHATLELSGSAGPWQEGGLWGATWKRVWGASDPLGVEAGLDERALSWKRAPIALRARISAPDLSFLSRYAEDVRRIGGAMEAQLALDGTLAEPGLSGSLTLERGELRTRTAVPALDLLEARITFDRDRIEVASLSGEFGAAPFQASGELRLEDGVPHFDLELVGERVLLARKSGVRLRADAKLRVEGPLTALRTSGALELRDGRYTRDVEFLRGGRAPRTSRRVELFSFRDEPWASMTFDVAISSQDPFEIDNNVVRGSLRPQLILAGSGAAPLLTGTIFVEPTRVKLVGSTFIVESGTIGFDAGNPMVPRLELIARTRVRGYDVTATLQGTPDDPPVLTSTPPLSQEELRVLVLTRQLPEQALSQKGGEQAAETLAFYLGEGLVAGWLGGGSEDEGVALLDRLEVQRGVDVSKSGVETTQVSFRVTEDARKDRLVYLRAEKDVYERINYGLKLLFRFE